MSSDPRLPESKILSLADAVQWRRHLADSGRKLALTNGCFDLLHRGHAQYLALARQQADALLVAMNSDLSVRTVKGPGRPVVKQQDRAYLLGSLEAVDAVVMFDTAKPLEIFETIVPDIYVKGGDYDESTIDREEHALLSRLGVTFRFVSFVDGLSTTETIRRVRAGDTV